MDGQKKTLLFFLLVFSLINSACQKKENEVAAYKNDNESQSMSCDSSSLDKTKFVVQYLDGRVEVITAENDSIFERNFLDQHIHEIKRVEYDAKIQIHQNEILTTDQVGILSTNDWGPQMIQADVVWSEGVYGQGVKVAVIDAAVDITHPQIFPQVAKNMAEYNGSAGVDDDGNGYVDDVFGWDFYKKAPTSIVPAPGNGQDPNVHGTHVAGIIAADPSKGSVQGVAPQSQIIPLNFMDYDGAGSVAQAIPAIRYAVAQGAKVINASWGGGCSQNLKDVIEEVGTKAIFLAAAGNEGIDYDRVHSVYYSYPAAFTLANQLTIAASTALDSLAGFSNRGFALVNLAAPGENIRSTVPTFAASSGAGYLDGTSMATPFVSGAAALLWSAKPNATVSQIKQALLSSVDTKSFKVSTRGRLNVSKALTEIRRIAP